MQIYKSIVLAVFVMVFISSQIAAQSLFQKTYTLSGTDLMPNTAFQHSDGRVIISGTTDDNDFFVLQIDEYGNQLDLRVYDAGKEVIPFDFTEKSNGDLVMTSTIVDDPATHSDGGISEFDPGNSSGLNSALRSGFTPIGFPLFSGNLTSVQSDNDKQIVAGYTFNATTFGPNVDRDIYLSRVDNGSYDWELILDDGAFESIPRKIIRVDDDLDGIKDDSYYIFGTRRESGANDYGGLVANIDSDGDLKLSKTISNNFALQIWDATQCKPDFSTVFSTLRPVGSIYNKVGLPDYRIYLGGVPLGNVNLLNFNAIYDHTNNIFGQFVENTLDDNLYIAGIMQTGPSTRDQIVMKTDRNGNLIWVKRIFNEITTGHYAYCMANDGGMITVGAKPDATTGDLILYVTKLNSNGQSGCNQADITSEISKNVFFFNYDDHELDPIMHTSANSQSFSSTSETTAIDTECFECTGNVTISPFGPFQSPCAGQWICGPHTGGTPPYTVQWYDQFGNPIPGANLYCYQAVDPGFHTIEVTDANGCTDSYQWFIAFPPADADAGPDKTVSLGCCVTLTTDECVGYQHAWAAGSPFNIIGYGSSITVCPTVTTTYYLWEYSSGSNWDLDDVKVTVNTIIPCDPWDLTSDPTPVLQDEISFKVYPNPVPSGSKITVELDSQLEGDVKFRILEISGRMMYEEDRHLNGLTDFLEITPRVLNDGLYILEVRTGNEVFTKKLVIGHSSLDNSR